jgi:hypothetical protein
LCGGGVGSPSRACDEASTVTLHVTRPLRSAVEELVLRSLDVLHVGPESFQLDRDIRAVSTRRVTTDVPPL